MAHKRGKYWAARIPDPLNKGKTLNHTLGRLSEMTKAEAKNKESILRGKILGELDEFFDISNYQDMTVWGLLDYWLEVHAKAKWNPKSQKDAVYLIRQLNSVLGEINIHDLTHNHINGYMATRRKDVSYRSRQKVGVSETTICSELKILKHAFKLASTRWEFTRNNPFAKVDMPEADVERERYLQDWEADAIENIISSRLAKDCGFIWFKQIHFMARITAIRATNLCEVEWQHIEQGDEGSITIQKSRSKNKKTLKVPFGKFGWMVIREILALRGDLKPTDRLFVDAQGRNITRNRISSTQLKICREAGVEDYRWHDNRHDSISKMIQNGVSLFDAGEVAGHIDRRSTARYAHLEMEQKRKAVEKNPIRYQPLPLKVVENV